MSERADSSKEKKPVHVFTQEHATRMYQCLLLIGKGLENGSIKSKAVMNFDTGDIETIDDNVRDALKPTLETKKVRRGRK